MLVKLDEKCHAGNPCKLPYQSSEVFCQGQWLRRGSPVLHNSTVNCAAELILSLNFKVVKIPLYLIQIAAGGKGACLSEPKTRNRNGASLSE
uniref:Uncharacterized protein n=1 Tax=Salix viminalis TaxID=40686 RepID=A0A6N2M2Q6_SALVM